MAHSWLVGNAEPRTVKVPDKGVVEAHVRNHDEILEKREESVDARLAKGVVAPVTVHRGGEGEQVPTAEQHFPPDETLFVRILHLVYGETTNDDVEQLVEDGAQNK